MLSSLQSFMDAAAPAVRRAIFSRYGRCLGFSMMVCVLSACLPLPRLSVKGAAMGELPEPTFQTSKSPAVTAGEEVALLVDASVLRLESLERSDPLPTFEVPEVSLASASIQDALQMVVGNQRVQYSISRALDGSQTQFGAVSAFNLSGSFDRVIDSLSRSIGFFYAYRNGVLHISPDRQFVFGLPPVEDAFAGVATTLQAMGARGLNLNKAARTVSFRASRPAYEAIREYLEYVRVNRAIVTYDVWIYEVILNDNDSGGIAWNKFRLAQENAYGGNSANVTGSAAQPTDGLGIALIYNTKYFSLDLFAKFLRSQGTLRTLSQPKLALLSGTQGQIKAGRKFVYVSQVGQTTSVAGSVTSTQTAELQTGVDMTLKASVDGGSIFTEVKLRADELNQFNTFTALGTQLLLPDTSAREVTTMVRSRPGDVVLLGGINIAREQNDRSGMPAPGGTQVPTSYVNNAQRAELVIVLRPRLIRFGELPATGAGLSPASLAGVGHQTEYDAVRVSHDLPAALPNSDGASLRLETTLPLRLFAR